MNYIDTQIAANTAVESGADAARRRINKLLYGHDSAARLAPSEGRAFAPWAAEWAANPLSSESVDAIAAVRARVGVLLGEPV